VFLTSGLNHRRLALADRSLTFADTASKTKGQYDRADYNQKFFHEVPLNNFFYLEPVVHADEDGARGPFGAVGTASHTGAGSKYGPTAAAEVHVVAFQKRRPARREHPLNATAGRPT